MMTIGLNSVTHNGEDLRSVKSMDDGSGYGDGGDSSISPKHRSGSFSSVVGDGGADGGFAEDENDDDQWNIWLEAISRGGTTHKTDRQRDKLFC